MDIRTLVEIKGMHQLAYDAVNLGTREFQFGTDYLNDQIKESPLPLVSSNLKSADKPLPWIKEYVIKDFDGFRVGILGVMSSQDALNPKRLTTDTPPLVSPEAALRRLVPEVDKKADYLILLSQLEYKDTVELLQNIDAIDLALVCNKKSTVPEDSEASRKVFESHTRGQRVGLIQLAGIDKSGSTSIARHEILTMGDAVKKDLLFVELIYEFFSERFKQKREMLAKKRKENMHQELLKGLRLSPEEFIRQHKQRKDLSRINRQLESARNFDNKNGDIFLQDCKSNQ